MHENLQEACLFEEIGFRSILFIRSIASRLVTAAPRNLIL